MRKLFVVIPFLFTQAQVKNSPAKPYLESTSHTIQANGKVTGTPAFKHIYNKKLPVTTAAISNATQLSEALSHQEKLLTMRQFSNRQQAGNLSIQKNQLKRTVTAIRNWEQSALVPISEYCDLYQISGDGRGNVKFTSYYSPVTKASPVKTPEFSVPLYQKPDSWHGNLPTRPQIMNGALKGKDLEIAYLQNEAELANLQMQGSGFLQFPDGERQYVSYNGNNGYKQRDKDIKLSYTFFKVADSNQQRVKGAAHVPLTPNLSVAVDKRFIPLGSCLLGAVPQLNAKGKFKQHQYRLLLAQDVGGGIRGAGHLDMYTGIGNAAKKKANLHHFGQIWLLLAKEHKKA